MAMTGTAKALADIKGQLETINGAAVTELPAVSASDNGKVLIVVDGACAAAELPADSSAETTSAATETVSGT